MLASNCWVSIFAFTSPQPTVLTLHADCLLLAPKPAHSSCLLPLHNHVCAISQKMYGKGCSRHTLTVYFSLLAGHKVLLVIYYVALYLSMRATASLPRGISVPKLC